MRMVWEDVNDRISADAGLQAREHKWRTGHSWFHATYGPTISCATDPDCKWQWSEKEGEGI